MVRVLRRALFPLLAAATLALLLALLAAPLLERRAAPSPAEAGRGPFIPYPRIEQAAGAIQLLRAAPSLDATVLRAMNSRHLRAEIVATAPQVPPSLHAAPRVAALVRDFAGLGTADELRAWTDAPRDNSADATEGLPALIVWRMADGRFLALWETDRPAAAASGPISGGPAVWIGWAGLVVASVALLAMRREARPLRRLAAAAAAFDGRGPGVVVAGGDAPEVRRLAEAVRGMQERVTLLLQERSFLIGAISHDLKTYLTRLRLRAEHVADAAEQARVVADLNAMTDLIETALAFARGTTVSGRRTLVDLSDLVAIEVAERAVLGGTAAIVGEEAADALVLGDPAALRRVLANLIDNAGKFGRGRVEIAVEAGPDVCRVLVDDDGPGISAVERAAIFSPFYRIEGSRGPCTGGSGLGLAIARQIVEAHGGTVAVEEGPLAGARFALTLPAAQGRGPT